MGVSTPASVGRQAVGGGRSPVLDAGQSVQCVGDDGARGPTLGIGNEADAARVVLAQTGPPVERAGSTARREPWALDPRGAKVGGDRSAAPLPGPGGRRTSVPAGVRRVPIRKPSGRQTFGQRRRCRVRFFVSPSAQARRQVGASGPVRSGVAPAWTRRRADHQSVVDSSARAATAASMRSLRRRCWTRPPGGDRVAEGHLGAGGPGVLHALAQDLAGACDVDGDDGHAAAQGQVGGAAPELLAPAVGGAAALGEERQAPAVVDELGGLVGAAAADPGALDGDGADDQGRQRRGHAGCRRSSRRRRPRTSCCATARGWTLSSSGVSRWLWWLATKIAGPSSVVRRSTPRIGRVGQGLRGRPHRPR